MRPHPNQSRDAATRYPYGRECRRAHDAQGPVPAFVARFDRVTDPLVQIRQSGRANDQLPRPVHGVPRQERGAIDAPGGSNMNGMA